MDDRTIIEDTRNKVGKHERKNTWWRNHGVKVVRRKLETGDYATADMSSNILVDTKKGLAEVAMDCGRDHARFAREMDRARDAGCRLVILIETTGNYHCVADVARWENDVCRRCDIRRYGDCTKQRCTRFKRRPMTGETLARIMTKMAADHGCVFDFIHPKMAAKRICDLLGVRYETGY
jgi:hypothetical protein